MTASERVLAAERPMRTLTGMAVAPGAWASAIPFPSPLAYSFSYALRFPAGVVVVDLGWDSDEAWAAFEVGLARAGSAVSDVVGVVVTHAHPDHYGLARRVRERSGAWIAAHPGERAQIRVGDSERQERIADIRTWLLQCGVPADVLGDLHEGMRLLDSVLAGVEPDVWLSDDTPVPDTDGALRPIHTPGHTAGSLCFHDRSRSLLLTGDHVLPKVTPNVAARPGSGPDPLRDFRASLTKLADVPEPLLVLPGHEWPFDRLGDRLAALGHHHDERLTEIAAAVAGGCETVWDVAQAVSWARRFADFTPRSMRSALAETLSHLLRLTADGRLRRLPGSPGRWAVPA